MLVGVHWEQAVCKDEKKEQGGVRSCQGRKTLKSVSFVPDNGKDENANSDLKTHLS
jgi:hypothetical protein